MLKVIMGAQKEPDIERPIALTPEPRPGHSAMKTALLCLVLLLFVGGGVGGAYYWQHKKVIDAGRTIASLNARLAQQKKPSEPPKSTEPAASRMTFIYKPNTSGLSLTLPKTYEVLVGADGNRGGAPGVSLKIIPLGANNIVSDYSFTSEVSVEVDNTFATLSNAVSAADSQMEQAGDCSTVTQTCNTTNFATKDATVAGLPAKLIIANGSSEYDGNVQVYVVGLGAWKYEITALGLPGGLADSSSPSPMLSAVLKGISIKPVTD